mmetsp:Transcript_28130/g.36863  ORF Transcript_28130/g.36863 Transcript_28130/m.36863 type:complete len:107 (+) Transcript_28130:92-412(+)|eukprot:CAMPEP_0117783928 /NCGR_PEP_ID=MMETSP0948-20121206/4343_1 /TAXON_ID=44440 /ORGANISM="Chattonella subsalsa, Strain CCMP2191" /LENGTH=106 /DNA_ID=CAMNT_0005612463 /DNA_START=64 /DNA_END=384 /DNA_ORIENTATION=-
MDLTIIVPTATVGSLIFFVAVFFISRRCCRRCCRSKKSQNYYQQVAHGLDDDERQFKRALEMQGGNALDQLFEFDDDDVEFDAKDLENLENLDNYRSNLVASIEGV